MMNLRDVYSDRYLPNNPRIRSSSTRRHYKVSLDDLDTYLKRPATLADLQDDTMQGFAKWLAESRKISPFTVNQRLNYISALWRWLAKRHLVEQWPDLQRVVEPEIIPRAWTQRQLAVLLKTLEKQEGHVGHVPAGDWWLNLHWFLWETGERISASIHVEWDEVDKEARTVHVPAELRKGKYRSMLYTISPELMARLLKHKRPSVPAILHWPHHKATLYNRYRRILMRAGLPYDRRSMFHRMRKSFASHLKASGGDPTYAFRHSSAKITTKSYLDPSIADVRPSHMILPRLDSFVPDKD